jgi:hypothetical protein
MDDQPVNADQPIVSGGRQGEPTPRGLLRRATAIVALAAVAMAVAVAGLPEFVAAAMAVTAYLWPISAVVAKAVATVASRISAAAGKAVAAAGLLEFVAVVTVERGKDCKPGWLLLKQGRKFS